MVYDQRNSNDNYLKTVANYSYYLYEDIFPYELKCSQKCSYIYYIIKTRKKYIKSRILLFSIQGNNVKNEY